jgi:hypothetical protein
MENSSTTTNFHNNQNQSTLLRQSVNNSSEEESLTIHQNPNQNQTNNNSSRPIISIQPQQMQMQMTMPSQSQNHSAYPTSMNFGHVGRSNSLGSSSNHWLQEMESHQNPQQSAVFHINNGTNHVGIQQNSILPPPQRFSSNQNLTNYGDKSNPREVQKLYEYHGSPYSLGGGVQEYHHHHIQHQPIALQYGPISYDDNDQYYPAPKANSISSNYCTATLPSCLRRSGSGGANGRVRSVVQNTGQQQTQPLKSILRNPLNSTPSQYQQYNSPHSHQSESSSITTPLRSYTPMSIGSGSRSRMPEEFEYGEALLPQVVGGHGSLSGSGSDEQSYSSYNYPDYSPNGVNGGVRPGNYSPEPRGHPQVERRYSNPMTEYQNDINRLDKDLDPESLSRLIELDLDSKL